MANPFPCIRERKFSFYLFEELVGKSLSTFCSSSLQNLSAGSRRHSFAETVYFTRLSFLGLVGSFHNTSPDLVFYLFSFLTITAFYPR